MGDVCIVDAFYLFEIAAILNIILLLSAWVKFESFWVRSVFAFDLALALKMVVETAVGEYLTEWPTGLMVNLWVVGLFTLGFFVMAPQLWGCVFFVIALIPVGKFGDAVWDQIRSFFRHSLSITMEQTNSKVALAGLIVFILFVIAMNILFNFSIIKLVVFGFVLAAKAVIGFRFIEIRIFHGNEVCCSTDSDPDDCPYWFNKWHWIIMIFLTCARIWFNRYIAKHAFCGIAPTGYNLLTAKDSATATAGEEDGESDDEPSETKPTVSLRKVKGKAPTLEIRQA
jgi:hypothetical protein